MFDSPSRGCRLGYHAGSLECFVLFDHCAVCRSCCHIEAGYPPLEVVLPQAEQKRFGRICIEDQCEHLGPKGCKLGDAKPIGCQLYPLTFDPQSSSFFFDSECPLLPEYQRQLADPSSEASTHLKRMRQAIDTLSVSDPTFLQLNFDADSDYFDIVPLDPQGPHGSVDSPGSRQKVKQ